MTKSKKVSLNNMEDIIKVLKDKLDYLIKIEKLDGITLECYMESNQLADKKFKNIEKVCTELKLNPIALELNEDQKNIFILQFPEMTPNYSESQELKLYKNSFKWLINNFNTNNNLVKGTPINFANYKDAFVKQAIMIHYRCNTNQYKSKLEDYLNNIEYRAKIDNWFLDYLKENNI